MLFLPAKVSLKVVSISSKVLSTHCDVFLRFWYEIEISRWKHSATRAFIRAASTSLDLIF